MLAFYRLPFDSLIGVKIWQAGCKGGGFALNNSTLTHSTSQYFFAGDFCSFSHMAKIAIYSFSDISDYDFSKFHSVRGGANRSGNF